MWGCISVEIANHGETVNTGRYKTTMYCIFKQEKSPKYFKHCILEAEEKHAHLLRSVIFNRMNLEIEANTLYISFEYISNLETRSRRIFYMKQVKGMLTGLVTFCVEIAFYNGLLKER